MAIDASGHFRPNLSTASMLPFSTCIRCARRATVALLTVTSITDNTSTMYINIKRVVINGPRRIADLSLLFMLAATGWRLAPASVQLPRQSSGLVDLSAHGNVEFELFQISITQPPTEFCSTGDINGDNWSDLLVGFGPLLPEDEIADGVREAKPGNSAGSARLLSGSDGRLLLELPVPRTDMEGFGIAVAACGPVNGASRSLLVVGTLGTGGKRPKNGAITWYSASGQLQGRFDDSTSWAGFGSKITYVGEDSSSNRSFLLVGAPAADAGGERSGGIVLIGVNEKDGEEIYRIQGKAYERFGAQMAVTRDFDNDGIADCWVATSNCSTIRLLSSGKGVFIREIRLPSKIADVSLAVLTNTTGAEQKLLIGDSGYDGESGAVWALDETSGRICYVEEGEAEFGSFGAQLTPAHDFDGDGEADLLISAPYAAVPEAFGSQAIYGAGQLSVLRSANQDSILNIPGSDHEGMLGCSMCWLDGPDDAKVGAVVALCYQRDEGVVAPVLTVARISSKLK